jgi:hypothetical protein
MPNVSVSNTPGLYIGSGASGVLNSAQQLYGLLSNSGNVNFALINNNTAVQSFFIGNTSVFSNANVAAYLPSYTGSLDNSSSIVALYANAATQSQQITNIVSTANANTAAYLLTATGNIGSAALKPNYSYADFFVGDGSQLINLPLVPTSYSNTNVAAYLPTYTGSLENSFSIIYLNANVNAANIEIAQVQSNLTAFENYANATFGTSSYGNANVATYLPTYTGTLDNSSTIIALESNAASQSTAIANIDANLGTATNNITTLFANAATQSVAIAALDANVGAFETYANLTFTTYSNTNVAAYLPVYGGTVNALSITGVVGQAITIEPEGSGDLVINADTIRVGDNNQDATIVSHGTGNLTLTTHQGDANQGNITLIDGANGNIRLYPNGSGVVDIVGNVDANYYIGDGSQLINLPVQAGTYSNTNVAAYLPSYTGTLDNSTTIIALQSNAASLQNQITGANTNISTNTNDINNINANLGAFQTYANANFVTTATQYGNANVAAYLPTYTGNLGDINTTYITANKVSSTTGFFWANGTAYSTGGGGGGSDFTTNLTVNGNYIINANLELVRDKVSNIGNILGTTTIDANIGQIQNAVVTGNITINTNNLTNFLPGQTITVKLRQATNANIRLLTSNIKYAGGSKVLSVANAAIDTITITYDGEDYLGALVKGYA